jgi:transposase
MTRTLTEKESDVKPGALFVGVDLGLKRNVAVVVTESRRRLAKFAFPHEQEGYAYFRQRLEKLQEQHHAPDVLVGMEPTNFFWKLLATDLEDHQIPYRLVNAFTVKKHREGDQLDRSKDDVRDAFTIADLLSTGKYTKTRLLHEAHAELRHYAVMHEQLRRQIGRHKNLLWNGVGQLFPELRHEFKDIMGQTAVALLRYLPSATAIRDRSEEDFIASVRTEFRGQRLQVAKLRRAYRLAKTSVGVRDGIQALQLQVRLQLDSLEQLQTQMEEVCQALRDTFLTLPESSYLMSVHGLGVLTAAIILAEIGDPAHYSNARQWTKLAGIQPTTNLSGNKTSSRTPMSRKGRSRLRTSLYFAVMRLVQVDDSFAQSYRQLQHRKKPLTKKQALGALMNRLLRVLWALIHHQTLYDPAFEYAA